MKHVDASRASGVLLYSVVNRGNGQAAASAEGHISLVSGWQGDVVPTATNQTIQVPRATSADGVSDTCCRRSRREDQASRDQRSASLIRLD